MIYQTNIVDTITVPIKHIHFDIQENFLNINIILQGIEDISFPIQLTREHLNKFYDCGSYSLIINPVKRSFRIIDKFRLTKGTNQISTYVDEQKLSLYENNILHIVCPARVMNFTNLVYFCTPSRTTTISSNEPIIMCNKFMNSRDFLPSLELTGPETLSVDAVGEYTVTADMEYDMYVYPRTTAGYINKQKLLLEKGVGKFKFMPMLVSADTTVTLTIDFKQRTDKANMDVLITE